MKLLGDMEFTYTIINSDAASNFQLQHMLQEYGEFKCKSISKNSLQGLDAILKFSPDIVFIKLDTQVDLSFQMTSELYQYDNKIPIIVGISNDKSFAYDAIKNGFFDYWLLPYNEFDIRKSLLRLKKKLPKEETANKLCLKSYRDFQYLNTDDILYLHADNNATEFVMKDGTINNAFKTLKTFEQQMPRNFVRIHQSYIVNINYVSGISYGKGTCTIKPTKLQLPFSKSYRENIDYLKKLLTKDTIASLN